MPKKKFTRTELGEDAFLTTPVSIVVADGISKSEFTSSYVAQALTYESSKFLLQRHSADRDKDNDDRFFLRLRQNLLHQLSAFQLFVLNTYDDLQALSPEPTGQAEQLNLSSSTTYLSVLLHHMKDTTLIRLYQKGDSQLLLFRLQRSAEGEFFYYLPAFLSKAQQQEFNRPEQFMVTNDQEPLFTNYFNDMAQVLPLQELDLLVAATDGLFDNVSLGLLAFLVNFLVEAIALRALSFDEIVSFVQRVVLQHLEVLQKHRKLIEKYFIR